MRTEGARTLISRIADYCCGLLSKGFSQILTGRIYFLRCHPESCSSGRAYICLLPLNILLISPVSGSLSIVPFFILRFQSVMNHIRFPSCSNIVPHLLSRIRQQYSTIINFVKFEAKDKIIDISIARQYIKDIQCYSYSFFYSASAIQSYLYCFQLERYSCFYVLTINHKDAMRPVSMCHRLHITSMR